MLRRMELGPVNVSAVVRNLKDLGRFIQFDRDGEHYLLAATFILRLRWKDAFRIQCKTETEERGKWYRLEKKQGFVESGDPVDIDAYIAKYVSGIAEGEDEDHQATPTGLAVTMWHDMAMGATLFERPAGGYIAVRDELLVMADAPVLKVAEIGDAVIVNEQFLIASMADEVWKDNIYIAKGALS